MTIQAEHIPATAMAARARSVVESWSLAMMGASSEPWDGLLRLLRSDRFAFALGGILWSALIFVVVHSPA